MLKTLNDIDFKGKRVLLRVDFNVPMLNGEITDDTRIVEALNTINYIISNGGYLSIMTHLGRPKGKKDNKYSIEPVVKYINNAGYFKAGFIPECVGDQVNSALQEQEQDCVYVLENLRFHAEEEANDLEFAKKLSSHFDCYVNDAFGTCHRKHASVYGVPSVMQVKAAGFLIEKEVKYFEKLVNNPELPFAAILGGAKVSDKIGVIESLLDKAGKILIGGAMAYTFLKYKGHSTGISLVEDEQFSTVEKVLKKAADKGVVILLPVDHIISGEFGGKPEVCASVDIPDGMMALDIGEKSAEMYTSALKDCKTILWNGPMGVFENDDYAKGTYAVAKALAELKATTVVGGGDSVAAVKKAGLADKMSHISTGGGASLEYIEFGTLPGIEILKK